MKILMVCLGNICRSPLAEGIMQSLAKTYGLPWTVESAGTAGYHVGEPPHLLSQKVARLNGIDIGAQRCRKFDAADFQVFDRIYAMDTANRADIIRAAGKQYVPQKLELLLETLYPGEEREVPDPWYGTEEGYHEVFALIHRACEAIIQEYQAEQNTNQGSEWNAAH